MAARAKDTPKGKKKSRSVPPAAAAAQLSRGPGAAAPMAPASPQRPGSPKLTDKKVRKGKVKAVKASGSDVVELSERARRKKSEPVVNSSPRKATASPAPAGALRAAPAPVLAPTSPPRANIAKGSNQMIPVGPKAVASPTKSKLSKARKKAASTPKPTPSREVQSHSASTARDETLTVRIHQINPTVDSAAATPAAAEAAMISPKKRKKKRPAGVLPSPPAGAANGPAMPVPEGKSSPAFQPLPAATQSSLKASHEKGPGTQSGANVVSKASKKHKTKGSSVAAAAAAAAAAPAAVAPATVQSSPPPPGSRPTPMPTRAPPPSSPATAASRGTPAKPPAAAHDQGHKRKAEGAATDGQGGASPKRGKRPPGQKEGAGSKCAKCSSVEPPFSTCAVCERCWHPACLDPPRMRRARAGWICDECSGSGVPPPKTAVKNLCPQCGEVAGKKCALCSACGTSYHPECLQPPMLRRPKGSSPVRGPKNWVCFHCECAVPVTVAPGEDDPEQMASLEWSENFEPPPEDQLNSFWEKAHIEFAAAYAAEREEEEANRRVDDVEARAILEVGPNIPEANSSLARTDEAGLTKALMERRDGQALLSMHRAVMSLTEANAKLVQMVASYEEEIAKLKNRPRAAQAMRAVRAETNNIIVKSSFTQKATHSQGSQPVAKKRSPGVRGVPPAALAGAQTRPEAHAGEVRTPAGSTEKSNPPSQTQATAAAAAARGPSVRREPQRRAGDARQPDNGAEESESSSSDSETSSEGAVGVGGASSTAHRAQAAAAAAAAAAGIERRRPASASGVVREADSESSSGDESSSTSEELSTSASSSQARAIASRFVAHGGAALTRGDDDTSSSSSSSSSSDDEDTDEEPARQQQQKANGGALASVAAAGAEEESSSEDESSSAY